MADHHHEHAHAHHHGHRAGGNLKLAFLLNAVFVILEISGGLWTNSVAILSDAVHDAGDCFSLGLAWYLEKLSAKRPDARFTYGYRRFSSLGALVMGMVLMAGLAFICWNSFSRVLHPERVHAPGMLAIAVAGILLNGLGAWSLRGGHSLNEKVASWHLLEDTLGWAAVLVGSVVMTIWDLPIIDPILAIAISGFVLWNLVINLHRVLMVFLQGAPAGFDPEAFDQQLKNLPGVVGSHHTHTWTLDGERHVFSTHLVMDRSSGREAILATTRRVHEMLRRQDFEHITVEIELEGEDCAADQKCDGEV